MFMFSLLKEKLQTKSVSVDMIIPGKYNIRDYKEDESLEELAQSIKDYGVLQPILVKKLENDMFEIISGYRRFLAAKEASIDKIPVIVMDICDKRLPIYYLAENLHRKNLNFFEEADALFKLIDEYNFTQDMISNCLGVTQSFIADRLNLLKLSKNVRDKIIFFDLDIYYALQISKLSNEFDQLKIIEEIVNKKLNIEQTMKLVCRYRKSKLKLFKSNSINSETLYIIKDIRLFDNTISEAINVMNKSGVEAVSIKSEDDNFIEYVVKIPKNKIYIRKSANF